MIAPTEGSAAVGEAGMRAVTPHMIRAAVAEYSRWGTAVDTSRPKGQRDWVCRKDDTGAWQVVSYHDFGESDGARHDRALAAAPHAALTAHPGVAAGDGGDWVTVPREATEAMWQAGREADEHIGDSYSAVYRAMIEAAPSIPDPAAQRPAPAQAPETAGDTDRPWTNTTDALPNLHRIVQISGGLGYRYFGDRWYTVEQEPWPGRPVQWPVEVWRYVKTPVYRAGGATPSTAPGGSDRERVARAAARRVIFGMGDEPDLLFDPDQAVAVRAGRVESEMLDLLALTPQPASPGAVEHSTHAWKPGSKMDRTGECDDCGANYCHCIADSSTTGGAKYTPPTGPDAAGAAGEGWLPIETAAHVTSHHDAWLVYVPGKGVDLAWGDVPGATHCHPLPRPPALAALPEASGAGEDADAGVRS